MSGRSTLAVTDGEFIGHILEAFSYGIYSGIFAMYLQYQFSAKCTDKRPNIIFYSLCILYILSVALVANDTARPLIESLGTNYRVYITASVISGCCDFIAQSILIYRCWIVWNRNIRVVIIPSIFAFTFLVLLMANVGSSRYLISPQEIVIPEWGSVVGLTSIAMTSAVNALVTGLIVFKIVKVYWEVKPLCNQSFGGTGGTKLRPIIFVIVESGLALFSIQLAWLVVTTGIVPTQAAFIAGQPIIAIQRMLNGITPTIIQVRVAMGFSFHDKESLVEIVSDLRFGSVNDHQKSENGISMDCQEDRDDDIGGQ